MDQSTFDRISTLFAARTARRTALASAAGAAAVAAVPGAEARKKKKKKQEEKTEFLFVQAAQQGTLSDNGDGSFDLTLEGHTGGTIYFSDRPQRVFGVSPTEVFLDTLGFPVDNPPNAALLVSADGVEDAAIVELLDPAYDEATGRLTYTVRILGAYDEDGLAFVADQLTDSELPTSFDQASLFIDDCSDFNACCIEDWGQKFFLQCNPLPANVGSTGRCWSWFHCHECWDGEEDRLDQACAAAYGAGFEAYSV